MKDSLTVVGKKHCFLFLSTRVLIVEELEVQFDQKENCIKYLPRLLQNILIRSMTRDHHENSSLHFAHHFLLQNFLICHILQQTFEAALLAL